MTEVVDKDVWESWVVVEKVRWMMSSEWCVVNDGWRVEIGEWWAGGWEVETQNECGRWVADVGRCAIRNRGEKGK